MIWFTSDNHFGHRNIIRYCGRPFRSVDHMDDTMVALWNEFVDPGDTVYHLGDFSMSKKVKEIGAYRQRLNGNVVLIRGNHDRQADEMRAAGFEVHDNLTLKLDDKTIYLAHIPVRHQDPDHPRSYPASLVPEPPVYDYHLCGHVHEKWRRRGNVINVGVDQWCFAPVQLSVLLATDNPKE